MKENWSEKLKDEKSAEQGILGVEEVEHMKKRKKKRESKSNKEQIHVCPGEQQFPKRPA